MRVTGFADNVTFLQFSSLISKTRHDRQILSLVNILKINKYTISTNVLCYQGRNFPTFSKSSFVLLHFIQSKNNIALY